ncbi:MAG: hydroxymethylglutaryl-CoA synthase family protein [Opitutales bacterium]
MVGIVAYGAYIPRSRLNRQAVYEANKWFAPGLRGQAKGERAMAHWDEDALTMAVEAARDCLTGLDPKRLRNLYFASTTHPFKDRQNAGVVAAALTIEQGLMAADVAGSQKAGTSALIAGLNAASAAPTLVVAADKRLTKVASANELQYGDGGAAVLLGDSGVIAERISTHSVSMDFVDHFRGNESPYDYAWEERWIRDEGYVKIVPDALKAALGAAHLSPAQVQHFIMPSLMPAVPAQMAKMAGIPEAAVRDGLAAKLGHTGAAHPLMMLNHTLESAKPGDHILVVAFGQGVDALVFKVMPDIVKLPKRHGVSGWLERRKEEKNYMKYLAFNELLPLDKGMRAEFDKKTALSILWRKRDMLYGLVGGKCRKCGTVQFPKTEVCVNPECHATDTQDSYAMADLQPSILSFTADELTYDPDPPAYYGMITFPEGGRFMADFTDCDQDQVKVGAKMRMTFRIRDTDVMRGGFKRYFWKAAPV